MERQHLLLHLNPDLTGRVREVSIVWTGNELGEILKRGCDALNLELAHEVADRLVEISYGNAGILWRLTLDKLEAAGVQEEVVGEAPS